jgi:nitrogen fixation NifU-like protein
MDMYRENILDHAQHQRNKGVVNPANVDYEAENALCGDRLRLTLRLDDSGRIEALGWQGAGCAISQASASMLGEAILGKTVDEALAVTRQEVLDMLGIPLTMNRMKCALLSLKALNIGLRGTAYWQQTHEHDED